LRDLTGIDELILNGEHVKDPINNEHLLWKIGEIGNDVSSQYHGDE
jgi:hypothetical protein